tara:strand:+ start:181 stop:447 length:267 start_codon:yes stop_codon:yes gene_type:complete
MEIKKNRYGHERTYEKISENKIRVMGESLMSRISEDENGNVKMFDFEGGPCFNLGGKIDYMKWKWKIKKITPDKNTFENLASVVLEIE